MRHVDDGTLHAWLDGELPDAEAAATASHVERCTACRTRLADARSLRDEAGTLLALDLVAAAAPDFEVVARAAGRTNASPAAGGSSPMAPWRRTVLVAGWAATVAAAIALGWMARDWTEREQVRVVARAPGMQTEPVTGFAGLSGAEGSGAQGATSVAEPGVGAGSRNVDSERAPAEAETGGARAEISAMQADASDREPGATVRAPEAAGVEPGGAGVERGAADREAGAAADTGAARVPAVPATEFLQAPLPPVIERLPGPRLLTAPEAAPDGATTSNGVPASRRPVSAAVPGAPPGTRPAALMGMPIPAGSPAALAMRISPAATVWTPVARTEAAVRTGMALYGIAGLQPIDTAIGAGELLVRTRYQLPSGETIVLVQYRDGTLAPLPPDSASITAAAAAGFPSAGGGASGTTPEWTGVRGDVRVTLRVDGGSLPLEDLVARLQIE